MYVLKNKWMCVCMYVLASCTLFMIYLQMLRSLAIEGKNSMPLLNTIVCSRALQKCRMQIKPLLCILCSMPLLICYNNNT